MVLGNAAAERKELSAALCHYELARRLGHLRTQANVGRALIASGRRANDLSRGLGLLRAAYEEGHLAAGHDLAMLYLEGCGSLRSPQFEEAGVTRLAA